jgi:hypothetical protein
MDENPLPIDFSERGIFKAYIAVFNLKKRLLASKKPGSGPKDFP